MNHSAAEIEFYKNKIDHDRSFIGILPSEANLKKKDNWMLMIVKLYVVPEEP